MRIFDVLFAFPGLILAIAIVAILGSGMTNVVIAVAVFSTPTFARLVRSKTLSLKNSVFVLAARNIGVSDARILFHHILPGAIPTASEIRVPQMIRENRSRPNSSVPNRCFILGPCRIAL